MRTTLIMDTNYFLISRAYIHRDILNKEDSISEKQYGCKQLFQTIIQQINLFIQKYPNLITDVLLVTDKGSWRKKIPLPESLKEITYKGQRKKSTPSAGFDPDWNYIFNYYQDYFIDFLNEKQIAIYNNFDIEGDDWAQEYSNRIFNKGNNVILWTTDCDWQQLIKYNPEKSNAIVWYNGKKVVISKDFGNSKSTLTPTLESLLFMNGLPSLNILKTDKNSNTIRSIQDFVYNQNQYEYIQPQDIILQKIITGDSSDNIKSLWHQSSPQTINITENMISKFNYTPSFTKDINIPNGQYPNELLREIQKISKFKSNPPTLEQLQERYNYNKQLVWLHPSQYPEYVKQNLTYKHSQEKDKKVNSSVEFFKNIKEQFYSNNFNLSHKEEIIPF